MIIPRMFQKQKEEPTALYAFWEYDHFPYLLSGEVLEQKESGYVKVKGYGNFTFKPVYMLTGTAGERAHKALRKVQNKWRVHEEAFRNGCGNGARKYLAENGLPFTVLSKLNRMGYQGSGYEEVFNMALRNET